MPDKPKVFGSKPKTVRAGGSATLRDHSAAYRRNRKRLLEAEPLCRYCRADGFVTPAVMLDHSLALSLGGSNDDSNLVSSCAKCNSDKAKAEAAFIRRGHDPRDVYLDAGLRVWFDKARTKTDRS